MEKREILKLFMASALSLGKLIEGIGGEVDCKLEGWDITFAERLELDGVIQFDACTDIRGTMHSFSFLFDRGAKIEDVQKVMAEGLKRHSRSRT